MERWSLCRRDRAPYSRIHPYHTHSHPHRHSQLTGFWTACQMTPHILHHRPSTPPTRTHSTLLSINTDIYKICNNCKFTVDIMHFMSTITIPSSICIIYDWSISYNYMVNCGWVKTYPKLNHKHVEARIDRYDISLVKF